MCKIVWITHIHGGVLGESPNKMHFVIQNAYLANQKIPVFEKFCCRMFDNWQLCVYMCELHIYADNIYIRNFYIIKDEFLIMPGLK